MDFSDSRNPNSNRDTPIDGELVEAMLPLMRTGSGQENSAFRQFCTSLFMPGARFAALEGRNHLILESDSG